jgi:phosphocarrier protein HPr
VSANPAALGEVRREVVIVNKRGLHARASAKFVNVVAGMDGCEVRVSKDGHSAAGGSILGLMMLGAAKGDTVELAVSGNQAEHRLAELVDLVQGGFGED